MSGNPFSDLLGGGLGNTRPKPAPTPEKGVQIHGRKFDGSYYVRASDVAALLEANDVLPGIAKKLRRADS